MIDDRFDETLDALAREHNRAPETPREDMWAAIAAARAAERQPPAAPAPVVIPMRRPPNVWWRWAGVGGALAATLLIGIVIGRSSSSDRTAAPATVAAAGTGATPAPSATESTTSQQPTTVASASSGNNGPPGQPPEGTQKPVERGMHSTATLASAPRGARASGGESRVERESALPYRVATMQHLATTEMLLVSLRTDVRAGRSDTTIARWAGDLLGTTRMLQDSPAGSDPQLKQLLDDLELVLAQIARLPGARGQAADLSLIDDAVQRRQLMTRLRAITPGT
ncbi:MAG TPA: hypothetical protein VF761_11705 [Gemmatimonadaceae bacterium]